MLQAYVVHKHLTSAHLYRYPHLQFITTRNYNTHTSDCITNTFWCAMALYVKVSITNNYIYI